MHFINLKESGISNIHSKRTRRQTYYTSSAGELGASVADPKPGGGGQEGVGQLFQGGGAGGVAVRGGDMDTYPKDRAGPEELPTRGRAQDHRKTNVEKGGRSMYMPSSEGGHGRGGVWGDLEGHQKEAE